MQRKITGIIVTLMVIMFVSSCELLDLFQNPPTKAPTLSLPSGTYHLDDVLTITSDDVVEGTTIADLTLRFSNNGKPVAIDENGLSNTFSYSETRTATTVSSQIPFSDILYSQNPSIASPAVGESVTIEFYAAAHNGYLGPNAHATYTIIP
ncbi:MAG: hypothetical protein KBC36_10975 [Spirochaetia bacterium]|nr:hypothetical protein [Spirochaetia bacterium]